MAPVVAFVGEVFAGTAFGGGFLGGLAQFGAGVVLNAAADAIFRREPAVGGLNSGQTVTARSPVRPRSMIYGKTRVGGVLAFMHTTGGKNEYLHLVVALANHRCQSIGRVYFDGEEAIAANGDPVSRYEGLVEIDKRLGEPDQSAFEQLIVDAPDKWTEAHRLAGCTCVYLRLKWDADAFATGLPALSFEVEGRSDIYDPRDETHGYTTNAALCVADYMADPVNGVGVPVGLPGGLGLDALIEAANVCDEEVPLQGGGTEKRYTCNGELRLGREPKTITEELLTAMAGRAAMQGVIWNLHAGAYRIPTVALTGDDARGPIRLATRRTANENGNGVRGQFRSPENDYQPDDFPALRSAVYLAEDQGRERWLDIVLPFTDRASAAQRIAKIVLERTRRQQSVQFQGKLSAYRAAVGSTATLSYSRWGFDAKPFEVSGLQLFLEGGEEGGENVQLVPDLTLRETSPLVYDWNATEEQIYAAAPRTTLPSAFDVASPGQPELTEELYETRRNAVKALIRVDWAPSGSAFVAEYQVEGRRSVDQDGDPTGDDWITFGRTDQTFWEIRDIQPGTWEVRLKALNQVGISSAYATGSIEAEGLAAPPQAMTGLGIQKTGGSAILSWSQSKDLDVRIGGQILIRHSTAAAPEWTNSVSYQTVDGAQATATVPLKEGTYLIRAEDASGIRGPVSAIWTNGVQAVGFTNIQTITEHPTFAGLKSNVETDGGGNLILTDVASEGVYSFATDVDLSLITRVRVRSGITVAALNLGSTIDDRDENIDEWADIDESEGAEIDVVVEMRTTDDDPAGTPTWSDWARVDSTEDAFRAAEFRATLTSSSPDFNVLLSQLSIEIDEVI